MKKRVYVLIIFISMILFTKPVFLWIDKLTMDTVEANKASYTNQDALLIVLAAIGGSLLLAALPGVIVSIVLRIVKGKPVRNNMETVRVRPVKKEKKDLSYGEQKLEPVILKVAQKPEEYTK